MFSGKRSFGFQLGVMESEFPGGPVAPAVVRWWLRPAAHPAPGTHVSLEGHIAPGGHEYGHCSLAVPAAPAQLAVVTCSLGTTGVKMNAVYKLGYFVKSALKIKNFNIFFYTNLVIK